MYKSSKILFLYGLITSTLIFLWAVFFKPQPENFGLILLLLPMVLFFWINARTMAAMRKPNEEDGGERHKNGLSMKIGIVILAGLFVSTASIYGFSALNTVYSPQSQKYLKLAMENNQAITELKTEIANMQKSQTSNSNLLAQIDAIKDEFENNKFEEENKTRILGINAETEKLTRQLNLATLSSQLSQDEERITLKDNEISTNKLYKEADFSSDVVARMDYGEKYPVIEKKGSWFLVSSQGQQGWILEKYVKEVE